MCYLLDLVYLNLERWLSTMKPSRTAKPDHPAYTRDRAVVHEKHDECTIKFKKM